MLRFSQQGHPLIAEVNDIVRKDFPSCAPLATYEQVRDFIVKQIGEWNGDWQPPSLLDLFEGFLCRFPLPRLVHFLDMILPQLSPIHTRCKSLLRCHYIRLAKTMSRDCASVVLLRYMFTSRAKTYMVRIEWRRDPLLLFSDERRIGLEEFEKFQTNEVGSVNKYHVQMGLPEGHSVLVYYEVNPVPYQAVLVSMSGPIQEEEE